MGTVNVFIHCHMSYSGSCTILVLVIEYMLLFIRPRCVNSTRTVYQKYYASFAFRVELNMCVATEMIMSFQRESVVVHVEDFEGTHVERLICYHMPGAAFQYYWPRLFQCFM